MLWISFLVMLLACASAHAAPIKVFLLAGQSNMVGSGDVKYLPEGLDQPQAEVLYHYWVMESAVDATSAWTTLRPRVTSRPTYGPEITFGRTIADATGETIAIVKVAQNGSGLEAHWLPSAVSGSKVWPSFTSHVSSALTQLQSLGFDPEIAAFVWVQGTTDSQTQGYAEDYAANMSTLAEALRGLYGSDLPIIHNQQHNSSSRTLWPFVDVVRAQKLLWSEADPYNALVSFDDLPLLNDATHYRGDAQAAAGIRLAHAYLSLVPEPATGAVLVVCLFVLRRTRIRLFH